MKDKRSTPVPAEWIELVNHNGVPVVIHTVDRDGNPIILAARGFFRFVGISAQALGALAGVMIYRRRARYGSVGFDEKKETIRRLH